MDGYNSGKNLPIITFFGILMSEFCDMAKKSLTTQAKPKGHRGKRYTLAEKTAVLKVLQSNNFNIERTARETGVGKTTINRWYDKMKDELQKTDVLANATLDIVKYANDREKRFLDKVYGAKEAVVNRIMQLALEERNMDFLQKTIKTLTEIDGSNRSGKNGEVGESAPTMNVYQIIENQLISKENESKSKEDPIIIEGDSEE